MDEDAFDIFRWPKLDAEASRLATVEVWEVSDTSSEQEGVILVGTDDGVEDGIVRPLHLVLKLFSLVTVEGVNPFRLYVHQNDELVIRLLGTNGVSFSIIHGIEEGSPDIVGHFFELEIVRKRDSPFI